MTPPVDQAPLPEARSYPFACPGCGSLLVSSVLGDYTCHQCGDTWTHKPHTPKPPPAPLPCPCCGSGKTNRNAFAGAWRTCVDCACIWDGNRRAPCPTCAELRAELGEQDQRRDMYPIETAAQEMRQAKSRRKSLLVCGPGWNARYALDQSPSICDGTLVCMVAGLAQVTRECPACADALAGLRRFPLGPLSAFEVINRAISILEGRAS